MKARTNISVDHDLLKQAQEKLINISGLTESAIRDKLKIVEIKISEITFCEFCKEEGEPETKDTVNKMRTGLSWLYPDEKWICNYCLKSKSRYICK